MVSPGNLKLPPNDMSLQYLWTKWTLAPERAFISSQCGGGVRRGGVHALTVCICTGSLIHWHNEIIQGRVCKMSQISFVKLLWHLVMVYSIQSSADRASWAWHKKKNKNNWAPYLTHWLRSKKCQCSAKFTTYSLFTDGCYTCGFCICSPLPLKSSVVPGLSFDMCSVGAAIAA